MARKGATIADSKEPDPIDDATAIELERESLKRRIRDEVKHGFSNFNNIIARFSDLTEQYTKEYIADCIREVRQEIIEELRNRDVTDEVLVFLEENESLIDSAHSILKQAGVDPKDKVAAMKAISQFRKQRMDFLQYYGVLPRGGWNKDGVQPDGDGSDKPSKEQQALEAKMRAADEIEARTNGG